MYYYCYIKINMCKFDHLFRLCMILFRLLTPTPAGAKQIGDQWSFFTISLTFHYTMAMSRGQSLHPGSRRGHTGGDSTLKRWGKCLWTHTWRWDGSSSAAGIVSHLKDAAAVTSTFSHCQVTWMQFSRLMGVIQDINYFYNGFYVLMLL